MTAHDPSAPVRIVVMEGDGIGPEITAATMEVVRAVVGHQRTIPIALLGNRNFRLIISIFVAAETFPL